MRARERDVWGEGERQCRIENQIEDRFTEVQTEIQNYLKSSFAAQNI